MARAYSGKKGKSGSKTFPQKKAPLWLSYKPNEIEALIVKLSKEGNSSAKIGIMLRDSYGIPDVKVITGKQITQIMKEKGLAKDIPEDLLFLIRRSIKIRKHMEENKQDNTAKRGLTLTESKIKSLVKYYKSINKLPEEWEFDPSKIRLYIG